ncbi:MAG: hypothetical protein PHF00_00030 [Elusimicrobia bacterium]|nr:hypothetical protein [Elusimicrobiota bacterium]
MSRASRLAWALCACVVTLAAYAALRPAPPKAAPGTSEIPPVPANRLSGPPSAPKNFGGSALDEPPPAQPGPDNETLHQELEAEKARMGIRKILPPSPAFPGRRGTWGGARRADTRELKASAPLVPLSGSTPALLADPEGTPGQAVYSALELARLWRQRAWAEPMPRVDFPTQMAVVVLGERSLVSIAPLGGRIVARYRDVKPSSPEERWRVLSRSELPVRFEPAAP